MSSNSILNKTASDADYPLVIEIVGPAGAGKTTLMHVLCERHKQIRQGVSYPKISRLPFFVDNTAMLLPTYLQHYRHSRWFTWKEIRAMINLRLWHQILAHQYNSRNLETTLFDHGPIFRLAHLHEFGPEVTKSPVFEQWWNRVLDQWINTLDVVIWLDAPNEILLDRVHGRGHGYLSRELALSEGHEFLNRYRKAYEQILAKFAINPELTLLHFKTDQKSPDQIANEITAALASRLALNNNLKTAALSAG
jgi:deoxyadenosine/deoxycytidine kinase